MLLNLNAISAVSATAWMLLFWVGSGVVMAILTRAETVLNAQKVSLSLSHVLDTLGAVNLFFSAALLASTGLPMATSSQPLWSVTLLLPALFFVSDYLYA